jgi:hypothetical protein
VYVPIYQMALNTNPSICIPRTLNNVNWRTVKDTFEQLCGKGTFEQLCGKGTVERVDIVKKRDDPSPFCRIFVHMRYWPTDNPDVCAIRQRLIDGETIKVVYDNPWFWKCSASHAPKPDRTRPKEAPFVEFGEGERSKSPNWLRRQASMKERTEKKPIVTSEADEVDVEKKDVAVE